MCQNGNALLTNEMAIDVKTPQFGAAQFVAGTEAALPPLRQKLDYVWNSLPTEWLRLSWELQRIQTFPKA